MTGKDLFNIALDLCGLRNGSSDTVSDTEDLEQRALSLINLVLAENAVLDCRIQRRKHQIGWISDLNGTLECSDIVANTVLPYGLARLFMLGEDDAFAADMNKLYNEARANALAFGKAKSEPITEVYE